MSLPWSTIPQSPNINSITLCILSHICVCPLCVICTLCVLCPGCVFCMWHIYVLCVLWMFSFILLFSVCPVAVCLSLSCSVVVCLGILWSVAVWHCLSFWPTPGYLARVTPCHFWPVFSSEPTQGLTFCPDVKKRCKERLEKPWRVSLSLCSDPLC